MTYIGSHSDVNGLYLIQNNLNDLKPNKIKHHYTLSLYFVQSNFDFLLSDSKPQTPVSTILPNATKQGVEKFTLTLFYITNNNKSGGGDLRDLKW